MTEARVPQCRDGAGRAPLSEPEVCSGGHQQAVQVRPRKLSRHSQAHSGSVSSAVGLTSTLGMMRVMG